MFISILLTYLYCLGAHRRLWMPFRPPFLTACERFAKNTSSRRINLFKRLFYRFILNQAKPFLPNPFQRGGLRSIGRIQRYHTVGGANGTTMVVMFVGQLCSGRRYFPYYSYSRNPTGREYFVPVRTLIGVKLLRNNIVARLYFIMMTIMILFCYAHVQQIINNRKKISCFAGHFDGHEDQVVRC